MKIAIIALAVTSAFSFQANAATTVTLKNIVASWSDSVLSGKGNGLKSTTSSNGDGTVSLRWGNGIRNGDYKLSGYDFTPAAKSSDSIVTSLGTQFDLGEFKHLNFPVSGDSLRSVNLNLSYSLFIEADDNSGVIQKDLTSVFSFTHLETPNRANDCKDSSNPCPDLVTIANATSGRQMFTHDGRDYTLFLSGIGNGINSFITQENEENSAWLRAKITAENDPLSAVPVPAALPLLLSGMGMLALFRRKDAA